MLDTFLLACCSIAGFVQSAAGAPLAGATVDVRAATGARTVVSDAHGRFVVHVAPGSYDLTTSTSGFAPVTTPVDARADVSLEVSLEPLDSPQLRQIGRVTVDGALAPVRSALPAISLTRAELDALGDDRVIDGLTRLPGATFARPDGGAASAIAVVALRGPDPSESLVAIDGQLLGDGNTGDLDLSRLPVAAFSAIDVTEGLGPEDTNGSNTFGGSINFVSLRPTLKPHGAISYSAGSFGRTEAWLNATGTAGRLGYALALDDQHERGFVNQSVPLFSAGDPACAPCATQLGSSVAARTALGALTWTFSPRSDLTARLFVLGNDRDQSGALNGLDQNASDLGTPAYGAFTGPGNQTFAQTLRAYQLRGRTPLGAGELTADLSVSDDDVAIAGGAASPYDVSHRDRRDDLGLTWQRTFATSQFAVGGYTRYESLGFGAPAAADGSTLSNFAANPLLGQTIDVLFARGGFRPIAPLHLDAGLFASRYTTFGSNLDGRFSAVFDADARTTLRGSVGTGFRAPLLIEHYAFPYAQLGLDGNNVFVGQGSASERPEHATEYELGATHAFTRDSVLDVSLYQTSLRDPIEIFYPLAAVDAGLCAGNSYAAPVAACVSYNGNTGNAVYQGAEFAFTQRFAPAHLTLTGRYGINIAYPKDLDAQFSNPTSGGNLVDDAQFLGIPQQQASLEASYAASAWHASASAVVRGTNNELAAAPFVLASGLVGRRFGDVDLSLSGTNLFNADAGRFTRFGAGQPYRGIVGRDASGAPQYGPLPTDALAIEPAAVRAILTLRR